MQWKRFLQYWAFVRGIHWSLMDFSARVSNMELLSKQWSWQLFEMPWKSCDFTVMWVLLLLWYHKYGSDIKCIILKLIMRSSSLGTRWEIVLRWMHQNLTNDKSTLGQVMAWCHQAISHYLSQCWPKSISTYVVTRPQSVHILSKSGKCIYVNSLRLSKCISKLTIIGSDDGLSPGQRQAWTNAGILLIEP